MSKSPKKFHKIRFLTDLCEYFVAVGAFKEHVFKLGVQLALAFCPYLEKIIGVTDRVSVLKALEKHGSVKRLCGGFHLVDLSAKYLGSDPVTFVGQNFKSASLFILGYLSAHLRGGCTLAL